MVGSGAKSDNDPGDMIPSPQDPRARVKAIDICAALRRHAAESIQLPAGLMARLPEAIANLMNHEDGRVQARALDVLVKVKQYNLAVAQTEDKGLRLDAGLATENVGIAPIVYRGVDEKDI